MRNDMQGLNFLFFEGTDYFVWGRPILKQKLHLGLNLANI